MTALLPDGRQRRECGFCGLKKESKQDQASAWAKHLCIDCPGADDEFKLRVFQRHKTAEIERLFVHPAPASYGGLGAEDVSVITEGSASAAARAAPPPEKKPRLSQSMKVDWCDNARASQITKAITRYFLSCAVSFITIENVYFLAMIKELNSAYIKHIPRVAAFRTTWVPRIFTETTQSVNKLWVALGNP